MFEPVYLRKHYIMYTERIRDIPIPLTVYIDAFLSTPRNSVTHRGPVSNIEQCPKYRTGFEHVFFRSIRGLVLDSGFAFLDSISPFTSKTTVRQFKSTQRQLRIIEDLFLNALKPKNPRG